MKRFINRKIAFRVFGLLLILAAGWIYIEGVRDFENGDIDFRAGHNYKGVPSVTNRAYRLAFVFAIGGIMSFGYSFQIGNDKKDGDDKSA